jgi:hypothetical protein
LGRRIRRDPRPALALAAAALGVTLGVAGFVHAQVQDARIAKAALKHEETWQREAQEGAVKVRQRFDALGDTVRSFAVSEDVARVLEEQADLPETIKENGDVVVADGVARAARAACVRIHHDAQAAQYHIHNWYIFDASGTLLGRAEKGDTGDEHNVGKRYEWRDYFWGAKSAPDEPYISRVYISEGNKGETDIGVAIAVQRGQEVLGVLMAELNTGSALAAIRASDLESKGKGTSVSILALSDCGGRPKDSDGPETLTSLERCQGSYLPPVVVLRDRLDDGRTEDASKVLLGENGSPTYTAAVRGTFFTVQLHHQLRAE